MTEIFISTIEFEFNEMSDEQQMVLKTTIFYVKNNYFEIEVRKHEVNFIILDLSFLVIELRNIEY